MDPAIAAAMMAINNYTVADDTNGHNHTMTQPETLPCPHNTANSYVYLHDLWPLPKNANGCNGHHQS